MTTEFIEVNKAAIRALEQGERVAMTTVVRVRGSAPRHEGARMVVWADGRIVGTVGGATLEQKVIEHAQQALRTRRGRVEEYLLSTDEDPRSLGLCGGEVEVHIEVLEPQATLLIIGAGHIATPLSRMAEQTGMRVVVVDDRPEFANQERFPEAQELLQVNYDPESEQLSEIEFTPSPSNYVVVATWGWDEPALAQLLSAAPRPAYVGLVASPTKARVIFDRLRESGIPSDALNAVHAPAGLDLGAESPGEIALSILAEILLVQRGASGRPLSEVRQKKA
jgi:xanthine dehydrogenase accessory factor